MHRATLVGIFALTAVLAAKPASAGLLGDTVNFFTIQGANATISPLGLTPNVLVGGGQEFFACVGPNSDNCVTSGLSVVVDITDSTIQFSFFGSTSGIAPGFFAIDIFGFDDTITAVTGPSLSLGAGLFSQTAFNPSGITFFGSTGTNFDAVGGRFVTFNITSPPPVAPEPASLALLAFGLAGAGRRFWRQRQAS